MELDVANKVKMVVMFDKMSQKNKKTGWQRRLRIAISSKPDDSGKPQILFSLKRCYIYCLIILSHDILMYTYMLIYSCTEKTDANYFTQKIWVNFSKFMTARW